MSLVLSRETMATVLLPDSDVDAVDILMGRIKGALAISIEEDDTWYVLIDDGESFRWINIEEAIPSGSDRNYRGNGTVTKLKPA